MHNVSAEEGAALEADGKKVAELDHMDGMETQSAPPDGGESADVEEPGENLQMMPDGEEDSSDEEAEGPEDTPVASEAEGPQVAARKRQRLYPPPLAPGAKRLNGKQRPPAAYVQAGLPSADLRVLKRPAMLKRPAAKKGPPPSKQCQGYKGTACQFNPLHPGEAARVTPSRGIRQCIFCEGERLQEAHAARRRGNAIMSLLCSLCVI